MLYNLENTELTEYKTCGHAHYKPRTDREKTLITHRKFRYFPITPSLQRFFISSKIIEHMT